MRFSHTIILIVLALCSAFSSNPAFAIQTYDDYTNRAGTLASISASDGQFGEQVSDYNGVTSFAVTDVALPGNSSLPVSVGRTHRVGGDLPTAPGLFGQWDIDLPYLHGIFANGVGWQVSTASQWNRCSSVNAAEAMKPQPVVGQIPGTNDDNFDGEEFWTGNRLHLPGGGDESMLLASTPLSTRPESSAEYRWVTTGNWYFRCLPALKNSYGEGFLAIAPDGTRYYFDWMITRTVLSLDKPVRLGLDVYYSYMSRQKNMIYPSRVEDRFGNWVNYQWSGTQLLSIQSSDGRTLNLNYVIGGSGASAGPRVSAVTDGIRTWQYGYDSIGNLVTVTLPDSSKWTLDMPVASISYNLPSQSGNDGCTRYANPAAIRYTYKITQPSGLTAEYTFAPRLHSRSRVWPKCSWDDAKLRDRNKSPGLYYYALSLINKKVSGPGVALRSWDFKYFSPQQTGSWYDCSSCTTTKTTEVTDSAGSFTRYTFSNLYGASEGRLLKVELGPNSTSLTTTNTYQYDTVLDTASPAYIRQYGSPGTYAAVDAMEGMVVPLRAATTTQEGTAFSSYVELYDTFARPLRVAKSNGLGYAKTDSVEYHDDLSLWVLGQVKKQTTANASPSGLPTTSSMDVSEVEYNAQALPWKTYQFGKLQQILSYWPDGNLNTATDGRSNTTWVGDYHRGIPRLIGYPDGKTESATVNDNGWITSTTDENGFTTGYGYDAMGRLAGVSYPANDSVAWAPQSLEFRPLNVGEWMPPGISAGQWRQYIGQGNYAKVTYFDGLWRPLLIHEYDVTNASGTLRSTRFAYDDRGRESFRSYPVSDLIPGDSGIRTFYDLFDRVTRVEQDSELSTLATTTEYLPGLQVRTTNPREFQTTTSFMAWDQPSYDLPILSQLPEGKVIQIARHPRFGWPLSLTQRDSANTLSQTRFYVYDSNAQLCKTIEPETGVTVTGYDAAGNPAWSASGLTAGTEGYASIKDCSYTVASSSGRVVTRAYDERNRLTMLNFPDGRGNQAWTYTPDGLPETITEYNTAVSQDNGTRVITAYTYNKRRLLSGESVSQPGWYTWGLGYGYDALGNLSNQTYPTGLHIDYAPNALGQPTKAGTYATGAQYYPSGALKQFTYGNGIVHTMTQNARQLPQRVTSSGGALDYSYVYDANGNPTHIGNELTAGYDLRDRWMTYDQLDRLTDAGSGSFGGTDNWQRFTYNALDNMTSWKQPGVKDYAEYVYDNATNRLTSIRNTASATVMGLDYDLQGNLRNKNGQLYDFDYGNRLRDVPSKESYRYDSLGRRVQTTKTDGSKTTLWQYSQAGQMLFSSDWDGANYANQKTHENVYLAGSVIATIDHDWPSNAVIATKYQHTDALGSPVAVTNTSGAVIERNDYEPYGAIIGKPTYSGIGYTGHVMDGATELTYMQQRYYDQSIGRFLSVDPVTTNTATGDNFNRYKYANDNPYRFVDPDGRGEEEFAQLGETINLEISKYSYRNSVAPSKDKAAHARLLALRHRILGLDGDADRYKKEANIWSRHITMRNPRTIRFLQDGHGETFKDGVSLDNTAQELRNSNGAAAKKILPIRVFMLDGFLWTLDHRRLVAHQMAGVEIQTVYATPQEVIDEWYKASGYRKGLDGRSIRPNRARTPWRRRK